MLASYPASMVNQKRADLGIPNRFSLTPSRFKLRSAPRNWASSGSPIPKSATTASPRTQWSHRSICRFRVFSRPKHNSRLIVRQKERVLATRMDQAVRLECKRGAGTHCRILRDRRRSAAAAPLHSDHRNRQGSSRTTTLRLVRSRYRGLDAC